MTCDVRGTSAGKSNLRWQFISTSVVGWSKKLLRMVGKKYRHYLKVKVIDMINLLDQNRHASITWKHVIVQTIFLKMAVYMTHCSYFADWNVRSQSKFKEIWRQTYSKTMKRTISLLKWEQTCYKNCYHSQKLLTFIL
jgi:hypothetical protein